MRFKLMKASNVIPWSVYVFSFRALTAALISAISLMSKLLPKHFCCNTRNSCSLRYPSWSLSHRKKIRDKASNARDFNFPSLASNNGEIGCVTALWHK
ncbi:hypothetical protein WICPIJ_000129 [Wickerhamomyces pijperi]|uniref:Uncharacterized protein n=1 Tax=Wickerhamomyces pijperi TaxID=599730 RepID=A0A9P8QHX4_WICPI|nr:hypothetical protein WICPIJ_000129 [Wickerhamomyces pijperi]